VIQDNSSVSHTEQSHQTIPTPCGLPNPDLSDPSLMQFLILLISMTDKVLSPWIAARLKPQKTKLNPDEKDSIIFNFTFNQVVNIAKEKDDLPKNKNLIDEHN
jgi:hypothetical protein